MIRSYNKFEKYAIIYWGGGWVMRNVSGNGKRSGELTSFVVQSVV